MKAEIAANTLTNLLRQSSSVVVSTATGNINLPIPIITGSVRTDVLNKLIDVILLLPDETSIIRISDILSMTEWKLNDNTNLYENVSTLSNTQKGVLSNKLSSVINTLEID